ncbi:MAG: 1-deoxy-D-xylulose-5-phosphate reductoisomerase [Actinomycetota bacterium]
MTRRRVAIAGSSGSIGRQTIEVALAEPDQYEVAALAVASSSATVIEQARALRPALVVVTDPTARADVAAALPGVEISADLADVVGPADVVINGVVGFAGLPVTMETLRAGKTLGLANKESLIAAGPIVRPLRGVPGAVLVPVDSEHCAIHQCLRSSRSVDEVSRIVLTASGGPFRGRTAADLATVRVDEALAHPTWSMGPKITVDSSTLMNKGLEVIEAHELFGVDFDRIDVVVHPQSVVHSMVEFTDGSTIAQLSMPDMRLPIGYALGWPDRITVPFGRIDWTTLGRLDFEAPDRTTFRCLDLAYAAGRAGGTAPATLSAANETAIEAFLEGRIGWSRIAEVVETVISRHAPSVPVTLDDVLAADAEGRRLASEVIGR